MLSIIHKVVCIITLTLLSNVVIANAIVPFELINGLIVIEAEIDGVVGNYILDSGSNGILLNSKAEKSDVSYRTLSGVAEGSETKINSLKLGNFESNELLGFSTDLSNLEIYIDKNLAGILGCAVFTPSSLEFNFTEERLIISDKKVDSKLVEGMSSMSYKLVDDLPIGELVIDGKKRSFIIDTGASSHFIDSNLIAQLGSQAIKTGIIKNILTASGESSFSEEYTISSLGFGKSKSLMNAFSKDFSGLSRELGESIHGLISLSKLSNKIIFFDIVNKKIYY
ncbi:MAG: hypothetical protein ACJA1A_000450 [Saprospiraceae bacterium]|jgi:hypothetical protein